MNKILVAALLATVLIAGCVGQSPSTGPSGAAVEVTAADVNSLGSDLTGFQQDSSELAVLDVDMVVP